VPQLTGFLSYTHIQTQLDDVVMAKYRGDWQPCVIKSLRNYPKRVTVVGLDYEFYGIWYVLSWTGGLAAIVLKRR